MPAGRFFLRTENLQRILDERDHSHVELAQDVGVTPSYWSQIFHRRRLVSPKMRRALLASPILAGVAREELFERADEQAPDSAQVRSSPGGED